MVRTFFWFFFSFLRSNLGIGIWPHRTSKCQSVLRWLGKNINGVSFFSTCTRKTIVLKVTWLTIIATFPAYVNVPCVPTVFWKVVQFHFQAADQGTLLLLELSECLSEVSAGGLPLSLKGFVSMWQDLVVIVKEEIKWKGGLKNTKSPSQVHKLENCAIEMGDTFTVLFKASLWSFSCMKQVFKCFRYNRVHCARMRRQQMTWGFKRCKWLICYVKAIRRTGTMVSW